MPRGGARPGAGAPRHNTNRLVHGLRTRDPKLRRLVVDGPVSPGAIMTWYRLSRKRRAFEERLLRQRLIEGRTDLERSERPPPYKSLAVRVITDITGGSATFTLTGRARDVLQNLVDRLGISANQLREATPLQGSPFGATPRCVACRRPTSSLEACRPPERPATRGRPGPAPSTTTSDRSPGRRRAAEWGSAAAPAISPATKALHRLLCDAITSWREEGTGDEARLWSYWTPLALDLLRVHLPEIFYGNADWYDEVMGRRQVARRVRARAVFTEGTTAYDGTVVHITEH